MLREQARPRAIPVVKRTRRRSFLRRRRFLIGGLVVALAIGLLIYQGIANTGMYYLTVEEYKTMRLSEATDARQVRIGGRVQEASVQWEAQTMTLRFMVEDEIGGESMPVVYRGVLPDAFKPGVEVILEGRGSPEGVFEASTLLTRCASKYVPVA